jgi:hypothetical protein
MVTFRTQAKFAGLASVLVLAGCVAGAPRSAESALEGQWTDQGGIAISTFNAGQFVTVDARTGGRLSEGTYRFRDNQNVDISMTALARGTQVSVSCAMVSPSQLNCTNSAGTSFTLTRRA